MDRMKQICDSVCDALGTGTWMVSKNKINHNNKMINLKPEG